MITIVYTINSSEREDELVWLREQKIFPSICETFNYLGDRVCQVGVIVSPEAALSIKLRHKLDIQRDYRQR